MVDTAPARPDFDGFQVWLSEERVRVHASMTDEQRSRMWRATTDFHAENAENAENAAKRRDEAREKREAKREALALAS